MQEALKVSRMSLICHAALAKLVSQKDTKEKDDTHVTEAS